LARHLLFFFLLESKFTRRKANTGGKMEKELKRRIDLVKNEGFRAAVAKTAKEIGITNQEWDENKAAILIYMANEACKMEDADPTLIRKF
jgi:hypothetical protein